MKTDTTYLMRTFFIHSLIILIVGCSSPKVDKKYIVENGKEMEGIFLAAHRSNLDTINSKDDTDLAKRIKDIGIDQLEIRYKFNSYSDFIHSDSLAYFKFENKSLWEPVSIMVFDFANEPRNFGDDENVGASYTRKKINERWYVESIGFD
jgi:hypothetical protein